MPRKVNSESGNQVNNAHVAAGAKAAPKRRTSARDNADSEKAVDAVAQPVLQAAIPAAAPAAPKQEKAPRVNQEQEGRVRIVLPSVLQPKPAAAAKAAPQQPMINLHQANIKMPLVKSPRKAPEESVEESSEIQVPRRNKPRACRAANFRKVEIIDLEKESPVRLAKTDKAANQGKILKAALEVDGAETVQEAPPAQALPQANQAQVLPPVQPAVPKAHQQQISIPRQFLLLWKQNRQLGERFAVNRVYHNNGRVPYLLGKAVVLREHYVMRRQKNINELQDPEQRAKQEAEMNKSSHVIYYASLSAAHRIMQAEGECYCAGGHGQTEDCPALAALFGPSETNIKVLTDRMLEATYGTHDLEAIANIRASLKKQKIP